MTGQFDNAQSIAESILPIGRLQPVGRLTCLNHSQSTSGIVRLVKSEFGLCGFVEWEAFETRAWAYQRPFSTHGGGWGKVCTWVGGGGGGEGLGMPWCAQGPHTSCSPSKPRVHIEEPFWGGGGLWKVRGIKGHG